MSRAARCLTIASMLAVATCKTPRRYDPAEAALAAAASDSLTVALADSLDPARAITVTQAGQPMAALSACDDRLRPEGWEFVGSRVLEMQVPPGFAAGSPTSRSAQWTSPAGTIRVYGATTSEPHSGIYGTITSECDVFVSGSPTHIDLVTGGYGREVHALIRVRDAQAISFNGSARTLDGQAQLLHTIRSARVSSAWGRPE